MKVDDLLKIAVAKGASDLHLKAGSFPHVRVNGELVPLSDKSCPPEIRKALAAQAN